MLKLNNSIEEKLRVVWYEKFILTKIDLEM